MSDYTDDFVDRIIDGHFAARPYKNVTPKVKSSPPSRGLVEKPKPNSFFGKGEKMKQYYKWTMDGASYIGERLVIDGKVWVMKLLDGAIMALNTHDVAIEKVMPYTVDVAFVNGNNGTYSFLSSAGEVAVGDLLCLKGYPNLAEVVAIDTKSAKATVALDGWVVSQSRVVAPKE